jgi:hypothetical protein
MPHKSTYTCSACKRIFAKDVNYFIHVLFPERCALLPGNNEVMRISDTKAQYDGETWTTEVWGYPVLTRRSAGTLYVRNYPS